MTPEQLDLACWPLFNSMTERGIRVDTTRLIGLRSEVLTELEVQEAALRSYAGRALNPYSPADVAAWLVEEGLYTRRRTSTGAVSTDELALSQLTDLHPVPGCVLECRGLRKMVSTFIDPVLHMVEGMAEPAVHPRWRLTKVKSGRPSMEDPNLLAFPARDEWGKRVRDCFVARPGMSMVSVDFSQVEPRVAAALSGDVALRGVFESGRDLYADMARRLFRLGELTYADSDSLTARLPVYSDADFKREPQNTQYRQPAKIILLGCVLYGMEAKLLYAQLIKMGCGSPSAPNYDMEACEDFVRRRFDPYPGLKALFERTVAEARRADGWATTQGGRRRFLPALLAEGRRWPAAKLREEAERQAFNHLIQGTAQEIMKKAMLRVQPVLGGNRPLLQIYDELVFEVPRTVAEANAHELAAVMADTLDGVEIKTTWSVADSWGGLK